MTEKQKAKELIDRYGKKYAMEIAKMIHEEHYRYKDCRSIYRGDFKENYTNAEICGYWSKVIICIGNKT